MTFQSKFTHHDFSSGVTLNSSTNQSARSQLSISPEAVVFEEQEFRKTMLISNAGSNTIKFHIRSIELKMVDKGDYEIIECKGTGHDVLARKVLKYTPRVGILRPTQSQTIRLSVRKPLGPKDDQYLCYLIISEMPVDSELHGDEKMPDYFFPVFVG